MPAYKDHRDGRWRYRKWIISPAGKKIRVTGTPPTDTKVAAEAAERAHIDRVMYPERHAALADKAVSEPKKGKTIRTHAEVFVTHYKPESTPSTKREKESALNALLPVFGDLAIEELTQQTIDAFSAAELKRGLAKKTINNRLSVLSSLIKYVTGEKSKLRFKLAGKVGEIHAVDPEDLERLLEATTEDRYRAVILLAAEAGLRAGEIRGLQWGDIRNGKVTIRRGVDPQTNEVQSPKHGKVRSVKLSPRILDVLESLPRLGMWVVSRLDGGLLGYWGMIEAIGALYDRAKVTRPPMLLHCLRHTFGTVMARKVPLPTLRDLMGHESIETTMRYVDVAESDKDAAIVAVFGETPKGNQWATESKTASKLPK
jgi:integrase